MDDRRRTRGVEQRVALRHRLAEPRADREDEIGLARLGHQRRIGADAEIAGEIGQRAVVERLAAEADADRDVLRDEEVADRRPGPPRSSSSPPRIAERAPGAAEHLHHARERGRIGMRDGSPARGRYPAPRPSPSASPRTARSPPGRAGRWSRRRRHARRSPGCARHRRSASPISRAGRTCGGNRLPGNCRGRSRRTGSGRRTAAAACCPGTRHARRSRRGRRRARASPSPPRGGR